MQLKVFLEKNIMYKDSLSMTVARTNICKNVSEPPRNL